MSERTDKLDEGLASIAKGYKDKIDNPEYLKQEIVKANGYKILDKENAPLYNQKAAELQKTLQQAMIQEIRDVQEKIKKTHQELEATRARNQVIFTNGRNLAREYAEQHKLTIDEAVQELESYASRKVRGYDPGFLPDQYAALRNINQVTHEADIKTAHGILSKQLEKAESAEARQEREHYSRLSSMTPLGMADYYTGSGYAYRKLFNQNT